MKKKILEDIALSSIKFSSNGKNISFEFLSTYDGKDISSLDCNNVFYFEYQNGFDEFDGFASYILEIYADKLDKSNITSRLRDRRYSFVEHGTNNISLPDKELYHIYFESNETIIDIFCESYKLESYS